MTDNQRKEFIDAVESGNHTRAVTIGLQIAAKLARDGDRDGAMCIRREVDREKHRQHNERMARETRLTIASRIHPMMYLEPHHGGTMDEVAAVAIRMADALMAANAAMPVSTESEV